MLLICLVPLQADAASNTTPKHEMRAAWISTVYNIDMPSGMTKEQYTSWARTTLNDLKGKKFNTVIFQVKPMNDAMYPSKLAPWSTYITGKAQGTSPGYDPLQIMLDEAHNRGMELHAWMNPYRVATSDPAYKSLAASNAARKNPDWVVKFDGKYYLNPGIPEVQDYLIASVEELVKNYDVDAIHMDDYFYPGKNFPDQDTFKKYGASFTNIADWRRNNVNELVRDVYSSIQSIKPSVQFGISPRGVWRNKSADPTGSDTIASTNYDDIYADTRQWIKEGAIDYIVPQIYWSRNFKVANYSILLDWWNREVQTYAKVHPVNLYIGVADYKVATDTADSAWNNKMEIPNQVLANRLAENVQGQMHFSLNDLQSNRLGYANVLKQQIYNYPAMTPSVSWKNSARPAKPTAVSGNLDSSGAELTITDRNSTQPRKYIIYRFDGSKEGSYQDSKNIIDVVYNKNGNTTYVDQTASGSKAYTYGITAVSATGVESSAATIVKVGNHPDQIFKDIDSSHRAYKEIEYLAQGSIVGGDINGKFNPSLNVTRAEAAAMIGRALNLDGTKRKTSFKDVGSTNFASGYIQSAADLKILSGYKDGNFKPYANVTRGEMAVMISKAFGYSYGNTVSGAASALKARGIAQGMEDGSFGADRSIIRADYAIFLARAINYNLRLNNPTPAFDGEKYVKSASLSIRKGPNDKYAQVGVLKKNDKVATGYQVGSWTLIKSESNVIGFVPNSEIEN